LIKGKPFRGKEEEEEGWKQSNNDVHTPLPAKILASPLVCGVCDTAAKWRKAQRFIVSR